MTTVQLADTPSVVAVDVATASVVSVLLAGSQIINTGSAKMRPFACYMALDYPVDPTLPYTDIELSEGTAVLLTQIPGALAARALFSGVSNGYDFSVTPANFDLAVDGGDVQHVLLDQAYVDQPTMMAAIQGQITGAAVLAPVLSSTQFAIQSNTPGNASRIVISNTDDGAQSNSIEDGDYHGHDASTGVVGRYSAHVNDDSTITLTLTEPLLDGTYNGALAICDLRASSPDYPWDQTGPYVFSVRAPATIGDPSTLATLTGPGVARTGCGFAPETGSAELIPADGALVYVVDPAATVLQLPGACTQVGNEFYATWDGMAPSDPITFTTVDEVSPAVTWLTATPWGTDATQVLIRFIPSPFTGAWFAQWVAAPVDPAAIATAVAAYIEDHPVGGTDSIPLSTLLTGIIGLFSSQPGFSDALALLAMYGIVPNMPATELDDFELNMAAWVLASLQTNGQELADVLTGYAQLAQINTFTKSQVLDMLGTDNDIGTIFDILRLQVATKLRARIFGMYTGASILSALQLPLYNSDDSDRDESAVMTAVDVAGDGTGFVMIFLRPANDDLLGGGDDANFMALFIKGWNGEAGFAITQSDLQDAVNIINTALGDKANTSDIPDVSGLETAIAAKASQTDLDDTNTRIDAANTRIDDLDADEVAYDDIYSPAAVAVAATMTDGHGALVDYTGTPQTITVRVDSTSGADDQPVTLTRDYTNGGLTYDDLAADIQAQVTGATVTGDDPGQQINFVSNTVGQNSRLHVGSGSLGNGFNNWYDGDARGADAHGDLHSFPGRDADNVRKATDLLAARTATLSAYQRLVPVPADAFFDSVESAGPYTVDCILKLSGKLRHNGSGVVLGFANPGPGLYAEVDVDVQNETPGGPLLNMTFASYVVFAQTYFDTTKDSTNLHAFVYGTEFTDPVVVMWQTSIGNQ